LKLEQSGTEDEVEEAEGNKSRKKFDQKEHGRMRCAKKGAVQRGNPAL